MKKSFLFGELEGASGEDLKGDSRQVIQGLQDA